MISKLESVWSECGNSDKERILLLGVKQYGLEFPIDSYLGYLDAFIYYNREKKYYVDFSIIELGKDMILNIDDFLYRLKFHAREGNIKVVTFSYDIYKAFLYGQNSIDKELIEKLSFEYIGTPITSTYELNIPSNVYFIFSNKTYTEYKYEFKKEVFNIYRCQGYSTDKMKSLPFKNDYERSILLEDKKFLDDYSKKGYSSSNLFKELLDRFLKPVKYRKEEEDRL